MKKMCIISLLLLCGKLSAQVDIPDPVFLDFLVNHSPTIDTDYNGEISFEEAESFTLGIHLLQMDDLTDLTGLEAFVNIGYLELNTCMNVTELDVTSNTALLGLTCQVSSLTSLDLSNQTFTADVSIVGNEELSTISFENSTASHITLYDNGLVDANFIGATIASITFGENQFEELNFGDTELDYIGFIEGSELSYINFNNGFEEDISLVADAHPNLSLICVEEIGNATQEAIEAITLSELSLTFVDDCIENPNVYTGIVSFDINDDGCNDSDVFLSNILINSNNDIYSKTVNSNEDGSYEMKLYTNAAPYSTSVIGLPDYFSASPAIAISDFVGEGNTEVLNFCIQAVEDIDDVNITIAPIIQARPGFSASYQLVYKNMGTNVSNGSIDLIYNNEKIAFTSASDPTSNETANTLSFDYSGLNPLEIRTVDLNFLVELPPTTEINDILDFTATISPEDVDLTPEDNEYEYHEEVIGSYDPNDVTVMEGEWLAIADIDNYLHYRIRFQNTGTAEAINIRVENDLDEYLDWSTLQLLSTSHPSRLEIENQNELRFYFDDINLIDSETDDPNSHGYIVYKIKPVAGITIGTIIESQAAIYFDFNEPVITNTVSTEVLQFVPTVSLPELSALEYTIYPVPATTILNINSKSEITKIELSNELGQLLISEEHSNDIDVSGLSQGLYFVRVTIENGNNAIQKFTKL